MLTKGDVLTFLGKASGPLGSYEGKEVKPETKTAKPPSAKTETAKASSLYLDSRLNDITDRFVCTVLGRTCAPQTYSLEFITIFTESAQCLRFLIFSNQTMTC